MNATDIAALHASAHYGSFVLAGGGADLLAALLVVPGASGTVADARVPYAAAAMAEYLGGTTDQAVAVGTARVMAMAALRQTLTSARPTTASRSASRSPRACAVRRPSAAIIGSTSRCRRSAPLPRCR